MTRTQRKVAGGVLLGIAITVIGGDIIRAHVYTLQDLLIGLAVIALAACIVGGTILLFDDWP